MPTFFLTVWPTVGVLELQRRRGISSQQSSKAKRLSGQKMHTATSNTPLGSLRRRDVSAVCVSALGLYLTIKSTCNKHLVTGVIRLRATVLKLILCDFPVTAAAS